MTMGTNLIEQAIIDVDDLAAQIERLCRALGLLQKYSVAGQEFARSLRWEALLPEWIEVIKLAAGAKWSGFDLPEAPRSSISERADA